MVVVWEMSDARYYRDTGLRKSVLIWMAMEFEGASDRLDWIKVMMEDAFRELLPKITLSKENKD